MKSGYVVPIQMKAINVFILSMVILSFESVHEIIIFHFAVVVFEIM